MPRCLVSSGHRPLMHPSLNSYTCSETWDLSWMTKLSTAIISPSPLGAIKTSKVKGAQPEMESYGVQAEREAALAEEAFGGDGEGGGGTVWAVLQARLESVRQISWRLLQLAFRYA